MYSAPEGTAALREGRGGGTTMQTRPLLALAYVPLRGTGTGNDMRWKWRGGRGEAIVGERCPSSLTPLAEADEAGQW